MVAKGKKQKKPFICNEVTYMTKEQLKIELKARGLKSSGTRNELLQRLGSVMATVKRKGDFVTYANGQANESNASSVNAEKMAAKRQEEREQREKIVLWLQPVKTLQYFSRHVKYLFNQGVKRLLLHKKTGAAAASLLFTILLVLQFDGPHQNLLVPVRKQFIWCLYWLGLGVLSSVGLGTGLHTFVLYLGPHIASVTIAAYECSSLNFPEPPYPDEIICPEGESSETINLFKIMSKVRLEAMMWGAGTALGELPPYFMARAARLSGYDPDDEDDLREFEELQLKKEHPSKMSIVDRAKLCVEKMVENVGFFAILACASIPNPLFDLAGITCGHFLVPFWTFFGATLIGKAFIKMHIQKLFVIIAFNEKLLAQAVSCIGLVPHFGPKFQQPLKDFLEKQKLKLHRKNAGDIQEGGNIVGWVLEKLVIGMILYFLVSIINSLAQSHHKRLCKEKRQPKCAKD